MSLARRSLYEDPPGYCLDCHQGYAFRSMHRHKLLVRVKLWFKGLTKHLPSRGVS